MYGPKAASHRVRLAQFRSFLREKDVRLKIQSLLGNGYLRAKFAFQKPGLFLLVKLYYRRLKNLLRFRRKFPAIVHAELFPGLPAWLELLLLPKKFIYDLDDAMFLKTRFWFPPVIRQLLVGKIYRIMKHAQAVTAGSRYLCEQARRMNRVVVYLPSSVNTRDYCPVPRSENGEFTIGWVGSPSTENYLNLIYEPLAQLAAERPVRVVLVGGSFNKQSPGLMVEKLAWTRKAEPNHIRRFDVGVMPLPDDDWARGKCGYKLLTYMACGIPVVASRVGANIDIVNPACGYLASSTQDWLTAFRELQADPELRLRMGQAGRKRVCELFSIEATAPIFHRTLEEVFGEKNEDAPKERGKY